MDYVERFLNLKCSTDILDILKPIHSGISKEISEAFSMIRRVKTIIMGKDKKYNILELCAGNPLFSVTSAFLLPVEESVAIDLHIPKREYSKVRKFEYSKFDIFNNNIFDYIDEDTIIVSIHPCNNLAIRITDIYNKSKSQYLFMMPCCVKKQPIIKSNMKFIIDELGNYKAWVYYLSTLCHGKISIVVDNYCLSDRNIVISASKNIV